MLLFDELGLSLRILPDRLPSGLLPNTAWM